MRTDLIQTTQVRCFPLLRRTYETESIFSRSAAVLTLISQWIRHVRDLKRMPQSSIHRFSYIAQGGSQA